MRWWIRPLVAVAVLGLVAAACSGTDGGPTTTSEATTTTSSTTTTSTSGAPTTTLPPVIITSQPGTFVVTDFGAVADGKNDDSEAFQAAVDAAAVDGGVVVIPSVGGRRSYVLNTTIDVPSGVAIVGAPAGSPLNVAGPYDWPDVDISGVKILARPSPGTQPMFRLAAGTVVRGLWITYDQQPFPTNAEIQSADLDYQYATLGAVQNFFVDEHVAFTGPTFYIEDGSQVVIEDVIADRYYDFLFMRSGGPLRVENVSLYGFRKGFTIADSAAQNTFRNIRFAPITGPIAPDIAADPLVAEEDSHSWMFGTIASDPDNVGFHFGRSDGFLLDNISFNGGHTAVRLGATFDIPIVDPLDESFLTSLPGLGPHGQLRDINIADAAVGLHLVSPSSQTLNIANLAMVMGIDGGQTFEAEDGTGSLSGVARQALVHVEFTYSGASNGSPPSVPAVLASNISVSSTSNELLYGAAAGRADSVNGRIFLVDGDIGMEINGFAVSSPFEEALVIASGRNADDVNIRIRGWLASGLPEADKLVEATGVSVLTGDILVIQPPPVVVTTTTAPTTTSSGPSLSTTAAP